MSVAIKVCGIRTFETAKLLASLQVELAGLVFFEASPRHLQLNQARDLAAYLTSLNVKKVALLVDPDEDYLDAVIRAADPEYVQLHGDESPQFCKKVKEIYGRKLVKALKISSQDDFAKLTQYASMCDYVLFDAKPPSGADRPGGHGRTFDWRMLEDVVAPCPVMLSGGLTPENVALALKSVRVDAVDVSSGVEEEVGVKSESLIRKFVNQVRKPNE